jgi:hypothetical protein
MGTGNANAFVTKHNKYGKHLCVNTDTHTYIIQIHIQGVSGEIVNILGGGSMDYSE